jgi:hypothetical protein
MRVTDHNDQALTPPLPLYLPQPGTAPSPGETQLTVPQALTLLPPIIGWRWL